MYAMSCSGVRNQPPYMCKHRIPNISCWLCLVWGVVRTRVAFVQAWIPDITKYVMSGLDGDEIAALHVQA